MTDEPTAPGADEADELDDDEPEVEGFMIGPKIGSMGTIIGPIKPTIPTGPAQPTPTGGGDTIQPSGGSGGPPGPVTFPQPS